MGLLFGLGAGQAQLSTFVKQDALQRISVFEDDGTLFVILAAIVEHEA